MYNESKFKDMVEENTILRCVNGSELYGVNVRESSDRDEMGICVEPLKYFGGFHEFEQYIYREAAIREGVQDATSRPGDLDLTIYSLRKFLRLAMQGNPSVIQMLFVYPDDCSIITGVGRDLQDISSYIISKQAGKRFLGYMESQRQRLLGERGQKKVNRPELEDKFGYDTKYAMHIVRLGFQGVELLREQTITLPMVGEERDYCKAVRLGEKSLQEVLTKAGDLERELKDLIDTGPLRDRPDEERVETWMLSTYWDKWREDEMYGS